MDGQFQLTCFCCMLKTHHHSKYREQKGYCQYSGTFTVAIFAIFGPVEPFQWGEHLKHAMCIASSITPSDYLIAAMGSWCNVSCCKKPHKCACGGKENGVLPSYVYSLTKLALLVGRFGALRWPVQMRVIHLHAHNYIDC